MHLKTCEIYECANCEHVAKTISSIKKHMHINKKECHDSAIHHVKLDRNNCEEADYKEYEQEELFEWKFTETYISNVTVWNLQEI